MTSPGHRCVPMNSMRSVWNIVGSYAAHSAVRVCRSPLDSRSCDYLRILNRCNRSAHWETTRETGPRHFISDLWIGDSQPSCRCNLLHTRKKLHTALKFVLAACVRHTDLPSQIQQLSAFQCFKDMAAKLLICRYCLLKRRRGALFPC